VPKVRENARPPNSNMDTYNPRSPDEVEDENIARQRSRSRGRRAEARQNILKDENLTNTKLKKRRDSSAEQAAAEGLPVRGRPPAGSLKKY
jgi:hypothetical protein